MCFYDRVLRRLVQTCSSLILRKSSLFLRPSSQAFGSDLVKYLEDVEVVFLRPSSQAFGSDSPDLLLKRLCKEKYFSFLKNFITHIGRKLLLMCKLFFRKENLKTLRRERTKAFFKLETRKPPKFCT